MSWVGWLLAWLAGSPLVGLVIGISIRWGTGEESLEKIVQRWSKRVE